MLFHSPPGVLFTIPSRYSFTIGRQEYLALERGRPSFPRDSTCPAVLKVGSPCRFAFAYRAITVYGAAFQRTSTSVPASGPVLHSAPKSRLTTPALQRLWAYTRRVWALPLSLATTQGISLISFPRGTEMFHFPRLPSCGYGFTTGYRPSPTGGFPHSDIPGSMPACGSPRRIGAYPVLHRLLAPRHPPCALLRLTKSLLLR